MKPNMYMGIRMHVSKHNGVKTLRIMSGHYKTTRRMVEQIADLCGCHAKLGVEQTSLILPNGNVIIAIPALLWPDEGYPS